MATRHERVRIGLLYRTEKYRDDGLDGRVNRQVKKAEREKVWQRDSADRDHARQQVYG